VQGEGVYLMAQSFPETAHLKTDLKKYQDNWDRIDWGTLKREQEEAEKNDAAEQAKVAEEKHAL
jgi:hypothetical protein